MKKIFTAIVCFLMIFSVFTGIISVSAKEAPKSMATLYNVYQDNMLFQQKKEAIFAGEASSGAQINCELYDSKENLLKKEQSYANKKGGFTVSFIAPEGGFQEYTVKLFENGVLFKTIKNVVFGELWLASGQSNMAFDLQASEDGTKMYWTLQRGSKWLRFLDTPQDVEYNGSKDNLAPVPQKNIPGCKWVKGNSSSIFVLSAVGYFFAEKLMKEINMPVGVLCAYRGASSITTWIPREDIEGDAVFLQFLKDMGYYVPLEDWEKSTVPFVLSTSNLYNEKTAAFRYFRPKGMIWYQGETDIPWNDTQYGMYERAFNLLQDSYSRIFGFGDKRMPVIFTQLASYCFGEHAMQPMNELFAKIRKNRPEDLALISIYDLPLTYKEKRGALHPSDKKPVGERMCSSALSFVYGKTDFPCSAPSLDKYEIKGDSIYVTLDNAGDGLAAKGKALHGFALCGNDGIFLQADAEIVSKDTVRIYSAEVPSPVAASYAYSQSNNDSNLFATKNGELCMPASPFATDREAIVKPFMNNGWMNCDNRQLWRLHSNEHTGFYDIWSSSGAGIKLKNDSAYSGDNGLFVKSDTSFAGQEIEIEPVIRYTGNSEDFVFPDAENDFSKYGKISFMVRNEGKKELDFSCVKIYLTKEIYVCPVIDGENVFGQIVPADKQWHKITLDLNTLYPYSNKNEPKLTHSSLDSIYSISFCFENRGGAFSKFSVDDFRFTSDSRVFEDEEYTKIIKEEKTVCEKILYFFIGIMDALGNSRLK